MNYIFCLVIHNKVFIVSGRSPHLSHYTSRKCIFVLTALACFNSVQSLNTTYFIKYIFSHSMNNSCYLKILDSYIRPSELQLYIHNCYN